ncbi:hypothetical protein DXT99_17475 [Pontibacter diazotrophicus]|uniref:Uncharacterized protein n=1 Tax=Pontibacter diazotrophicus TaxID=1400979 RepID=A0A3D8L8S8_9BACT|nr:hypothetical protein [Pontibacter diazotrophicus]RDV13821.1 hypothetical protein DXT99_17475 [Pontibacter diazotrophicus]
MESYFRRFFIGHLLVLIIVACTIFYFGKSKLIATLLFVGLIEFLLYYLDAKYLPKRRAELTNELIELFKAEPFSEGVLKFRMGAIDFFVTVEVDFKKGLQLANIETVEFHIPKAQSKYLSTEPELEFREDKIAGIQTYNFYQTSGEGLKLAKENLEQMFKK